MILKDNDGGVHYVQGGHHRSFPAHTVSTFGTSAQTAVRAANQARSSHVSPARGDSPQRRATGRGSVLPDAAASAMECDLNRVESAGASGAEDGPSRALRLGSVVSVTLATSRSHRSFSVASHGMDGAPALHPQQRDGRAQSRSGAPSEVDDEAQSHKGGGTAWSTASGFAPFKPSAELLAAAASGGGQFRRPQTAASAEFHTALESMRCVVDEEIAHIHHHRGRHTDEMHGGSPDDLDLEPAPRDAGSGGHVPPLQLHDGTLVATTSLSPTHGSFEQQVSGLRCLQHIGSTYGVDAAAMLRTAVRFEEWVGVRPPTSSPSTPIANSISPYNSHFAAAGHHQPDKGSDVTLDQIETLHAQSPAQLFEIFVRLGAHDPDDARAAAAAATVFAPSNLGGADGAATTSSTSAAASPSQPSSPVSASASVRRSGRAASAATGARGSSGTRASSPNSRYAPLHFTALPWFSRPPAEESAVRRGAGGADDDNAELRMRYVLPLPWFIRDTPVMPKAAAACFIAQVFPDLGLSVHWNGTLVVPPAAVLELTEFTELVNLYAYLISAHDFGALHEAFAKRLSDMKKAAAAVHRQFINAEATASKAKRSFVRAKTLIMKMQRSGGGIPATDAAAFNLNSESNAFGHVTVVRSDDDDSDGGDALARGMSGRAGSMRRSKSIRRTTSHTTDGSGSAKGGGVGDATGPHVGFGETVVAIPLGAGDEESAEAQAIRDLAKRVASLDHPLRKAFPEEHRIPALHGRGVFAQQRAALARVGSRLLAPSQRGGSGGAVESLPPSARGSAPSSAHGTKALRSGAVPMFGQATPTVTTASPSCAASSSSPSKVGMDIEEVTSQSELGEEVDSMPPSPSVTERRHKPNPASNQGGRRGDGDLDDVKGDHQQKSRRAKPRSNASTTTTTAAGNRKPFRWGGLKTKSVTYEPVYDPAGLPSAVPAPPPVDPPEAYFVTNPWKASATILAIDEAANTAGSGTTINAAEALDSTQQEAPAADALAPRARASVPAATPSRNHASLIADDPLPTAAKKTSGLTATPQRTAAKTRRPDSVVAALPPRMEPSSPPDAMRRAKKEAMAVAARRTTKGAVGSGTPRPRTAPRPPSAKSAAPATARRHNTTAAADVAPFADGDDDVEDYAAAPGAVTTTVTMGDPQFHLGEHDGADPDDMKGTISAIDEPTTAAALRRPTRPQTAGGASRHRGPQSESTAPSRSVARWGPVDSGNGVGFPDEYDSPTTAAAPVTTATASRFHESVLDSYRRQFAVV